MKIKYGITKTFLYSMVILAFISVGLAGYSRIVNEYERFKKEEITLREEYVNTRENLIKNETDKVIDYIEYKKSKAETRLKQIIRSRTNEAYAVAINLYNQHRATKSLDELKKIIIDALRPIRYNNQRGYYFITRLDGVEILFADRPEMEGLNIVVTDPVGISGNRYDGQSRGSQTVPPETG